MHTPSISDQESFSITKLKEQLSVGMEQIEQGDSTSITTDAELDELFAQVRE